MLALVLAGLSPTHPVIVGEGDEARTAGDLLDFHARSPLRAWLSGRHVAVVSRNDLFIAAAALVADGVAARLLLCPPDVDPEVSAALLRSAEIGCLLTDDARWAAATESTIDDVRSIAGPGSLLRERTAAGLNGAAGSVATRWLIPTSGTTGKPKLIAHSFASLTRTAKRDREKGSALVWGLSYSITRFAGLQVFLQSILSGSLLALPGPDAGLERRLRFFAEMGCNALSATPSLWRRILMSPEASRLGLKQITLGGEIADQTILTALRQRWPSARIVHIYASTEAGVGFSVKDGQAGFPASFLTDPPSGVRLRVGERGTLLLKAEGADQTSLDRNAPLFDADGFIDTLDRVQREGDRYLFLGRENGAINVGGNKVQPEEVEHVLLGCAGIRLAAVRGRLNPITGMIVEARLVQDPGLPKDGARKRAIQQHCRAHLAAFKVPALIRFVDGIELSPSGKQVREV